MCGSLRHLQRDIRPGGIIRGTVYNLNTHKKGTLRGSWDGFARRENLSYWLNQGWKPARISNVTSFVEGHGAQRATFQPEPGKDLGAVYRDGKFKLVTRPAMTDREKAAHHRFPHEV